MDYVLREYVTDVKISVCIYSEEKDVKVFITKSGTYLFEKNAYK